MKNEMDNDEPVSVGPLGGTVAGSTSAPPGLSDFACPKTKHDFACVPKEIRTMKEAFRPPQHLCVGTINATTVELLLLYHIVLQALVDIYLFPSLSALPAFSACRKVMRGEVVALKGQLCSVVFVSGCLVLLPFAIVMEGSQVRVSRPRVWDDCCFYAFRSRSALWRVLETAVWIANRGPNVCLCARIAIFSRN